MEHESQSEASEGLIEASNSHSGSFEYLRQALEGPDRHLGGLRQALVDHRHAMKGSERPWEASGRPWEASDRHWETSEKPWEASDRSWETLDRP